MQRAAFLLVALFCIAACGPGEPSASFGLTTEGPVEGTQLGGLRIYRGIPFAAPPTERAAGRFREAARPRTRSEPFVANSPAPDCPQPSGLYAVAAAQRAGREQSEDCLALDIWTPADSSDDALPVLVWVHGGGLVRGSPARSSFDPSALARRGLVVVAIRYRLGALGFLAHPALEAEGASGLYGLGDQLRALRWVHANAAAFGGDARRITIGGQSAGAASLLPLLASPEAQPLYAAAILQSPVVDPLAADGRADRYASREAVLETGAAAARALGAEGADALRRIDSETWANSGFAPKLSLDGETFPTSFRDTLASDALGQRRLMIGFTDDEPFVFLPAQSMPRTESELLDRVAAEGEGGALEPSGEMEIAQRYSSFIQREAFEKPVREIADAADAAGWTVYAYRFSGLYGGARHAADVALLFASDDSVQRGTAYAELRSAVQDYWASFVRDGEPRTESSGAVSWPPYDPATGRHLVLSGKIHSAKR